MDWSWVLVGADRIIQNSFVWLRIRLQQHSPTHIYFSVSAVVMRTDWLGDFEFPQLFHEKHFFSGQSSVCLYEHSDQTTLMVLDHGGAWEKLIDNQEVGIIRLLRLESLSHVIKATWWQDCWLIIDSLLIFSTRFYFWFIADPSAVVSLLSLLIKMFAIFYFKSYKVFRRLHIWVIQAKAL